MSTTTTNLKLIKPAYGDAANIEVLNQNSEILDSVINYDQQVANGVYEGRDIATIPELTDEISAAGTVWDFLIARVKAHNYSGLRIGDYFTVPNGNNTKLKYKYRIAAFDHYCGLNQYNLDPHIVCVPYSLENFNKSAWSDTGNNNGTSEESSPYLASKLRQLERINFPFNLNNALLDLKIAVESRYSSSAVLDRSTSYKVVNIGKFFSLSETEVYGTPILGTLKFSCRQDLQLPLFRNMKNRTSLSDSFWLRNVCDETTNYACAVAQDGSASRATVTTRLNVAPCFLIGGGE